MTSDREPVKHLLFFITLILLLVAVPAASKPAGKTGYQKKLFARTSHWNTLIRNFTFSPDRKRYAYRVGTPRGNFVVVDGKPIRTFDDIHGKIHFSPDSKRIAWVATRVRGFVPDDTQCLVMVDGKKYPGQRHVFGFKFSPDSKRTAWLGRMHGKWRVYVDGKPVGTYKELTQPRFSPDSRHYTHIAKENGKWFVIINGKKQNPYRFVEEPRFSNDGKRYLYIATVGKEQKQRLIVDGKVASRDWKSINHAWFSPDGKSVVFAAKSGKGELIVHNGRAGKVYEYARYPVFSHDSKRLAFMVHQRKKVFAVVDNRETPHFTGSWPHTYPNFSPDNKKLAFVVWNKREAFVVINGKRVNVKMQVLKPKTYLGFKKRIVFSPDSKRVSWRIVKDSMSWAVVVDGKQGNDYSLVSPQFFSPDSRAIAWIARIGRKNYLVVNGKKFGPFYFIHGRQKSYDNFFGPETGKYPYIHNRKIRDSIRFLDDRRVRIFVTDIKGDVYRVVVNYK